MIEPEPLDIVAVILQRWKRVLLTTVVCAAAASAYAFLAPSWYSSTLRVIPAVRSQDAASSLASKLPFTLDSVATEPERIQAVLKSNSVTDEVVEKFKLSERYGASNREHTREALWKHCGTESERKSNVVTLTCEDKDPQIAMAMAAYFGEVGNRVFRRVSASSSAEERKFLETQVLKARTDVDEASNKLREFQEKHKIIDLPEQSKATISAMAALQGELLSKQLELSYLSGFSARTESSVVQLQQQIAIMKSKLNELEASQQHTGDNRGSGSAAQGASDKQSFFPSAMNVPELRFALEQLVRDQKIKETVFFLMTQRYEMAKIDEARDTSTFQILDAPTLPTSRSRPARKKITLLGGLAGAALGCCLAVVPIWWRRRSVAAA
jgi:tyrosine-protein kinase Etk/Wzc